MKVSTGLRNGMLVENDFCALMNGAVISIFSGPVPATADAAITGSNAVLGVITKDGDGATGLTFAATATGGTVLKNGDEVWRCLSVDEGVAAFYRMHHDTDVNGASTTEYRIQGTIAAAGADLNMNPNLVQDAQQDIDYFAVSMPTL